MKTCSELWAAILVVGVLGCAGEPAPPVTQSPSDEAAAEALESGWEAVDADQLSDAQRAQQQRCVEAQTAMASRLMAELQEALAQQGPAAAIEVCSLRAPEIAAGVANEFGVHIGRTSYKLRNAANEPPTWAMGLVDSRIAEPTWVAGPEGELGGLLPITMQDACLRCHGSADSLSADVTAALADLYPNDEATGFEKGQLRGWFWVEAPATS
jgi:hypothetical protein